MALRAGTTSLCLQSLRSPRIGATSQWLTRTRVPDDCSETALKSAGVAPQILRFGVVGLGAVAEGTRKPGH